MCVSVGGYQQVRQILPALVSPALFPRVNATGRLLRRSEWVVIGFLIYAIILACIHLITPSVRERVLSTNVLVLAGFGLLIRTSERAIGGSSRRFAIGCRSL